MFCSCILTFSSAPRMRVVGVRAVGDFPCARCLVPVNEISQMGTSLDQDSRLLRKRVDDTSRKNNVEQARKLIYGHKNYAVDADKVEKLLKPTSLVPSRVRNSVSFS